MAKIKRFIDIGANLTDLMYDGIYNGKQKHESDLVHVLKRCWNASLKRIIVTGGSLEESRKALELAKTDERLFSTVGCHPTRCTEFETGKLEPAEYLEQLKQIAASDKRKIVAIGECGLDYDRLQFCPKDVQKKYFEWQLELAKTLDLPLFLHCRKSAMDLFGILKQHSDLSGVVHSFDGTIDEAKLFLDLGYYIGLNGCSLKTTANLETAALLPRDKIVLETDCPWCEVRPTHAGYGFIANENRDVPTVRKEKWKPDCMVKGRNEPIHIRQVLDILAHVRNENVDELAEDIYQNTIKLFWPSAN